MLCIEKFSKSFKLFGFVFFVIILLGLTVYFMNVVLEKLFAEKTSISQSKESIEELPIPSITLCFINSNMRITKYEYVSDFIIRYEILVMKLYKTSIFQSKEKISPFMEKP